MNGSAKGLPWMCVRRIHEKSPDKLLERSLSRFFYRCRPPDQASVRREVKIVVQSCLFMRSALQALLTASESIVEFSWIPHARKD